MDDETTGLHTVVLLIRSERGFSRRLNDLSVAKSKAMIDGPYGGHNVQILESYDKILFMASGIGIAPHLLSMRHLLLAHDEQTARVRRLSLVWFLDTKGNLLREFEEELVLTGNRSTELG
jgi:predicted ferric reductase